MIRLQKILTLFIGIGAVVGAVMMWIDPTGQTWRGAEFLENARAKMPWGNALFKDFIPSGIVLLALIGFTQFAASYLLFQKHRLASNALLACGLILMLWTALEWWLFGFNALSNLYFVLGLIEVVTALNNCKKILNEHYR